MEWFSHDTRQKHATRNWMSVIFHPSGKNSECSYRSVNELNLLLQWLGLVLHNIDVSGSVRRRAISQYFAITLKYSHVYASPCTQPLLGSFFANFEMQSRKSAKEGRGVTARKSRLSLTHPGASIAQRFYLSSASAHPRQFLTKKGPERGR